MLKTTVANIALGLFAAAVTGTAALVLNSAISFTDSVARLQEGDTAQNKVIAALVDWQESHEGLAMHDGVVSWMGTMAGITALRNELNIISMQLYILRSQTAETQRVIRWINNIDEPTTVQESRIEIYEADLERETEAIRQAEASEKRLREQINNYSLQL